MLYPKSFEDKLEFNKIRELIKRNCIGELGASKVDRITFSFDFDEINRLLKQTSEFKHILLSAEPFPSADYFDYNSFLLKASKFDSFLSEEEFHNLKLSISTIGSVLSFFIKKSNQYPELALLSVGIYLNPILLKEITRVLDEHGKVKDNASPELNEIRSSLRKLQFKVRKVMENLLSSFISDGYSNDDANVTIRNGRLVLPVRAEFKRNTGGFIHDESASGQTAFIEPASALEINNDILDLEYQERREVIKILSRLTDIIRPEISNLGKCIEYLGLMDFIRAKAKLAVTLDAIYPELIRKPSFNWKRAKHPLLAISHQAFQKPVVPLDIKLDSGNRILLISGPNAGGKSVCLKTVGLIQYMLQCGLLVPVSEGSTMGIFNSILVDIGDEQSIENDLSTYSSHLINMKAFISYAGQKTLILIDEFGTGTEPQFGGAIAESILDHLLQSKAYGIITTHYSNLKKYAEEHQGIINGAMQYDLDKMEPLFLLEIGKPGSSFALEIAAKIGLPENILITAKKKVGIEHVNYEKLLVELENEKRKLDEKIMQFSAKERELKKMVGEYEELKNYLENKKQNILHDAKTQALDILKEANKTVEKSIREIRESQADKKITQLAREKIESSKKTIAPPDKKNKFKTVPSSAPDSFSIGNIVRIKDQDSTGQIISIRGKESELIVGHLKIKIPINRLELISRKNISKQKKMPGLALPKGLDINEKMQNFSDTLDIRGQRGNEAMDLLDHYLDQALFLSKKEVKILHGKGNGILRKMVREQLLRYNFIKSAKDEHVERGGDGITIVTLK